MVPALPPVDTLPDLACFAHKDFYGSVAFEQEQMIGFLCFYPPVENAFGTTGVKGTFSPMHAHGAVKKDRGKIFSYLYQDTAEKLVKSGIRSHAVALYAHDSEAENSFFNNGFGLRCVDAIRPLIPITAVQAPACTFFEVEKEQKGILTQLHNALLTHLSSSPCFMPFPLLSETEFLRTKERENARYFAAQIGKEVVAYIKIGEKGENFACDDRSMQNICGACCLPEYRGTGLYCGLLSYLSNVLIAEGYTRLGVDFESFNPTARGFWLKHFTPYTHSVVRRIDDKIIESK